MIFRDIGGTAFKSHRIVISRYDAPSTILPFCFKSVLVFLIMKMADEE